MDSDTELVDRARKGDITAFKKLVTKHKNNVYYLAYDLIRCREDAEDISQDVFIKVYRSLSSFKGDSKFSTWLYRITINTCLSLKKSKSFNLMTNTDVDQMEDIYPEYQSTDIPDPEIKTESVFISEHIELALQKLSGQERLVFTMRNINGMPFNEIVEILKLQPGTVRSLNFRALKKLSKVLSFYKR